MKMHLNLATRDDPDGRRWETYFVHEDTHDRDEPGMTRSTTDASVEV